MTRGSIEEYAQPVRGGYKAADRSEKTRVLHEFTMVHRRLLATDVLTQQQQDTLANLYQSLNSVHPLAQINNNPVRL